VLVKLGADLSRVRQGVIQELSGYASQYPEYEAEPRVPRPQIRPVRCGFCNTPSPACGTLYTGVSGALICETCIGSVASQELPTQVSAPWSRVQGMVERTLRFQHAESVEQLAARVEPTGPPPEDEEAARQAIFDAFMNTMEVGADGRTLINVEDGAALAECAEEIRRRVGQLVDQSETVVEHIKFLDSTTAAVWSTTLLNRRPPHPGLDGAEGRAVFVDGRWKVARDTMCLRWSYAGVQCPPRGHT